VRFKVDENLPAEVTETLRAADLDAFSVPEQGLAGTDDDQVARVCRDEGRILVTLDVGFSDIRSYRPGTHAGIVVLRLRTQEKHHILRVVQQFLAVLRRESVAGSLWIVEETRVRIRS
jgi:predicted nuclease of predicted toxin-antitoxin system